MTINSERGLELESPIKNTLETYEPERTGITQTLFSNVTDYICY